MQNPGLGFEVSLLFCSSSISLKAKNHEKNCDIVSTSRNLSVSALVQVSPNELVLTGGEAVQAGYVTPAITLHFLRRREPIIVLIQTVSDSEKM